MLQPERISSTMIRCIIVDDEVKSQKSLKILLEDFCKNVSVLALCKSVAEAEKAIIELKPDLIFLDIELRRETGFDLLTRLENFDFEVIFTTAYSEYAIKAFKFAAIDYLLKPIDIKELKNALERVAKIKSHSITDRLSELVQNLQGGGTENPKLALPTSEGLVFVKIADILYCEAVSNYTEITMVDGKKFLVTRTLKEYEELLPAQNFFRIHHSSVINLNAVKKYVRGDGGYVVMVNDKSLDVSKRKKDGFLERIAGK
jgi:two-component system, LytTR family, response regulator